MHKILPLRQSLAALLLSFVPSAPACVSVTGAGGKSSLLETLAQILLAAGQRVLFCSTTKVWRPEKRPLLLAQSLPEESPEYLAAECQRALAQAPCVELAWSPCPASPSSTFSQPRPKLQGLPPALLTALYAHMSSHVQPVPWLLVEADGAACHPLKAHAPHEPALPACTELCIACAGLDGLLSQPQQDAQSWPHSSHSEGPGILNERFVHRAALAANNLNLPLNSPLRPAHVAALALPAFGAFHGPRVLFLNKADLFPHALVAGTAIAQKIHAQAPAISCFLGSVQQGWCQALRPEADY